MITSLPNLLSLSRILVIPLFVVLLLLREPWAGWTALALFVAAAATDWLDGWLARRRRQVTPLGRFLDPVADKLLVTAALVLLIAVGMAPQLAALLILCREILVSSLREFLAEHRVGLPVSRLAKWKTAFQLAAITVLLAADALAGDPGRAALAGWVGGLLLWVAAALSLVTAWDYLRVGLGPMIAGGRRGP